MRVGIDLALGPRIGDGGPPTWETPPSISGLPTQDQTLTGDPGVVLNGSPTGYQWLRDGVPISGATGLTRVLTVGDVGELITFRVYSGDFFADSDPVGPVSEPNWVQDASRLETDFVVQEYWNPITSSFGPITDVISVVSAAGLAVNSQGELESFAANEPRLTDLGLRVECYSITNLVTSPNAPATQTITLAAGTYTASCWGAGSVAITGPSIDVDAAQGLPQTFTLASGADVTLTPSGTLSWMQLEAGTRTSMPVSGTRAADAIVPIGPLATATGGTAWTVVVDTDAVRANVQPILGAASDKIPWFRRTSAVSGGSITTTGTLSVPTNNAGSFDYIMRAALSGDATTIGISAAAQTAATSASMNAVPITLIGKRTGASLGDDSFLLRKLAVTPTRTADASLPALSTVAPRYIDTTFTTPSTIDPVAFPSNLVRIGYDTVTKDAPIVVLMHGWQESTTDFGASICHRLAQQGLFAVIPNMRGRPALTNRDGSGREIYDIIDAVRAARALYPEHASQTVAHMMGFSGGGGNALGCAMKFPDFFASITSCFGVADYGYDPTNAWYYTNTTFQATINTSIGNPATFAATRHRSRYAIEGVPANLQGGQLFLFHDDADTSVSVVNSRLLAAAMDAAGNTRYTYRESNSTQSARWLHALPTGTSPITQVERIQFPKFRSGLFPPWTFSASGSARVHGYLSTKRFEIFLDDGKSSVATVDFDTVAGTYLITPVTAGSIAVAIQQGTLTASQTISSPTTLTVA